MPQALLFNGGGLEKTNTIVRELNLALEGNEPEVKALLKNSESFVTVLDDNKQAILDALEKINRLSLATVKQRKSITQALDDIPPALKILNSQRDDLVRPAQLPGEAQRCRHQRHPAFEGRHDDRPPATRARPP